MKGNLPWTYWPLALAGLVIVMLLATAICVVLGLNPYTGATIAGLAYGLGSTWIVARKTAMPHDHGGPHE